MSADERREQLLDVLADLVLSEGYGAASIDRIAREAGIARTVVYAHFGNLEGMQHALIARTENRALQGIRRVVPDAPVGEDPDALLLEALHGFLRGVHDDPITWRLALLPIDGAPAELRGVIQRAKDAVSGLIVPVIAWGLEQRGGPRGLDPALFTRLLITVLEDTARLVLEDPHANDPDRIVDFTRTLLQSISRD
ncbi:TetR/AcrR family transcriptional regulator [Paraconexibacter algicola]|uniref:HTH tetR-type domain-containing protein n=1 Tax=Paraconexibacter algicola TaxID=2133960 RepID=A0A2T4UGG3_9ACTN|nr:TetR/AcrR family transcriptional regulator [Paraconexibacter algicola]PTL58341.1 hypothetical protein C7Y72_01090 [Paraconexibacter algicola]